MYITFILYFIWYIFFVLLFDDEPMHTGLLIGACHLVTGCSLAVGVLISFKSSPKPAGNVENNQNNLVTRPFPSRMFWSIYDTLHWIVISFLLPTAIVLLACYCWWVSTLSHWVSHFCFHFTYTIFILSICFGRIWQVLYNQYLCFCWSVKSWYILSLQNMFD